MAPKGGMYSLHLINAEIAVPFCVDINKRKQGKFSPLSGLKIQFPYELKPNRDYAIICMNPNYLMEIELQCHELGLKAQTYNPDGHFINSKK